MSLIHPKVLSGSLTALTAAVLVVTACKKEDAASPKAKATTWATKPGG